MAAFLAVPPHDGSARITSSRTLCEVSFEHAESARILIATGNFTSALGVLRMQYEALVKAVWVLYAAADGSVAKLQAELKHESANAADKVPPLVEMLGASKARLPRRQYGHSSSSKSIHGSRSAPTSTAGFTP